VPDFDDHGISGRLSDAPSLDHVDFIGILSRMEYRPPTETRYECLVVLSGPEPQRTLLEERVLASLQKSKIKTLIVRGLPGNTNRRMVSPWVEIVDYLGATELQDAISQSAILVSRSGYSSVMDWVKIRRHAVLIPTPGQTEQEYLGKYLTQKKWFLSVTQDEFELTNALEQYKKVVFSSFPMDNEETAKEFCYRELKRD
jgi:UDP-N-acetylglucosamine transferase subunit ALG13